jgi:hypothetical protein
MPITKMDNGNLETVERTQPSTDCEFTTKELSALKREYARATASVGVKLKFSGEDPPKIVTDHADQEVGWALLLRELGTADLHFVISLILQLAQADDDRGEGKFRDLNFVLSVIKDLKPRNHREVMLGAQMAIIHAAFMRAARCLTQTEPVFQCDAVTLNKLSRTYVMLMDTLHRSRMGETQSQEVSVTLRRKAVVANINHPASESMSENNGASTPTGGENGAVPDLLTPGRHHLNDVADTSDVRPTVSAEDCRSTKTKTSLARARPRRP